MAELGLEARCPFSSNHNSPGVIIVTFSLWKQDRHSSCPGSLSWSTDQQHLWADRIRADQISWNIVRNSWYLNICHHLPVQRNRSFRYRWGYKKLFHNTDDSPHLIRNSINCSCSPINTTLTVLCLLPPWGSGSPFCFLAKATLFQSIQSLFSILLHVR